MSRGFTMMELLLVMTLASIMIVISTVALRNTLSNYRLDAARSKVGADLRYARQQAMARSGWYGVRFQTNPVNRYNVYYTDGTSDIDVFDPVDPSRVFDVNLFSDFGGVIISGVNMGGGSKVEFSPMGVPHSDMLSAPLIADGVVTLSLGGDSVDVNVIANTGVVEPTMATPGCDLIRRPPERR